MMTWILTALLSLVAPPVGETSVDTKMLSELRALEPLVLPHHCWPANRERLLAEGELITEYTRIIGSLGVFGPWYGPNYKDPDEIQAAIRICAKTGATITLNFSPFHRMLCDTDPRVPNARAQDLYRQSLELIREHLDTWNRHYGTDVRIGAVLLDSEWFVVKRDDEEGAVEWNLAIQAKLVPFYTLAKQIIGGDVPVYWYSYRRALGTPWDRHPQYLPCDTVGSFSLYMLPNLDRTMDDFRRYLLAMASNNLGVWVALGGGYDCSNPVGQQCPWNRAIVYPLSNSETLGKVLNQRPRINHVVFCPGPFPPDARWPWPYWHDHFVAYVTGANKKG